MPDPRSPSTDAAVLQFLADGGITFDEIPEYDESYDIVGSKDLNPAIIFKAMEAVFYGDTPVGVPDNRDPMAALVLAYKRDSYIYELRYKVLTGKQYAGASYYLSVENGKAGAYMHGQEKEIFQLMNTYNEIADLGNDGLDVLNI